jgi:hypothetical protein
MLDKRENTRIINLDSILLMLILSLGLLIYHNTYNNNSDRNKNSAATESSVNQNSATFCSGIRLQTFQKIRISNIEIFKIFSFARIQFLENRKVDQKISLLQNIRIKTERIPISIFRYHLFPAEKDELPLLS